MSSPISCEDPAPPLPSNNDISGIGVIVNYVGTAGLATLLVIVYYFMAHEPANDPFRVTGESVELLSRPNPVDLLILRSLRGALKRIPLPKHIRVGTNRKTELFFLKSIVIMADLQVLSGLTILISGFAQLRSGLATYYWITVVQLAWFSCLTHLCCLTLLRNHLYNNAIERGWRLVAMAILAIIDIVGLVFTGNYHWAFCSDCDYRRYRQLKESGDAGSMTPAPNDYAICFMSVSPSSNGAFASMVVAILLIILGLCTRLAKLYKPLSVGVFGRLRARMSRDYRSLLRRVYIYSGADRKKSLRWSLLYLPLLSIFLMGRFLLDQWSSLFLEVFWLLVSFTWGIAHVSHFMNQSEVIHFKFPDGNFDWSFGQVLSVLLLIAPVISILESLSEVESTETDVECISRQVHVSHSPQSPHQNLSPSPINQDPMAPDHDWDLHQPTLKAALIYFNLVLMIIYVTIITSPAESIPQTLFDNWVALGTFVAPFLGLFGVILFSLSMEPLLFKGRTVFPALFILLTIAWFTTAIAWPAVEGMFIFQYTAPMQVFPFVAYFVYVMIRPFVDLAESRDNACTTSQV